MEALQPTTDDTTTQMPTTIAQPTIKSPELSKEGGPQHQHQQELQQNAQYAQLQLRDHAHRVAAENEQLKAQSSQLQERLELAAHAAQRELRTQQQESAASTEMQEQRLQHLGQRTLHMMEHAKPFA